MRKVLIIDNYDSFVYNLVRYVEELGSETHIVRNDNITIHDITNNIRPTHIILSPGPCTPNDAGICMDLIKKLGSRIPILGVCLGHQAIATAYGGTVTRSSYPQHGKSSNIKHINSVIFSKIPSPMQVARYHSLIVSAEEIPDNIQVTAWSIEGEIMAIQHKQFPVWGVQFHPESILTPGGKQIIENFLSMNYEV